MADSTTGFLLQRVVSFLSHDGDSMGSNPAFAKSFLRASQSNLGGIFGKKIRIKISLICAAWAFKRVRKEKYAAKRFLVTYTVHHN